MIHHHPQHGNHITPPPPTPPAPPTHNMANMAPSGTHPNMRKRARDAYKLRCMHRTWDDIADALGFGSPASAYKAVQRHIARMPSENQQTARALSAGTHSMVAAELISIGIAAKQQGKLVAAIEALDKASGIQDRHDKLIGLHVNVPQQVEITVNESPAAAIRSLRDELITKLAQQSAIQPPLPVLDAEVVDEQPA